MVIKFVLMLVKLEQKLLKWCMELMEMKYQCDRCFGWFCEGREEVQDDPRSGCPSQSQMDGNIEKMQQLLL